MISKQRTANNVGSWLNSIVQIDVRPLYKLPPLVHFEVQVQFIVQKKMLVSFLSTIYMTSYIKRITILQTLELALQIAYNCASIILMVNIFQNYLNIYLVLCKEPISNHAEQGRTEHLTKQLKNIVTKFKILNHYRKNLFKLLEKNEKRTN